MNDIDKTVIGAPDDGERTQMVDPQKTQMGVPQQANVTQYAANVECPVCHTPNPPSEKYCMDCGFLLTSAPAADIPEVVSYSKLVSADGTQEFALKSGENLIGREGADVLLTHNSISRKHAKITIADGKSYIEDLGSTNGTYVNGNRINQGEKPELVDGCELVFGSSTFKYDAPEAAPIEQTEQEIQPEVTTRIEPESVASDYDLPESPETQAADETPPEEAPKAPVIAGRLVSKDGAFSFDISNGVNTIGRRAGANDIVLSDPYCSGQHAELAVKDGKFVLTDVGSTNGTLVNGVKLEHNIPREVLPDDEITLGRSIFKIEVA